MSRLERSILERRTALYHALVGDRHDLYDNDPVYHDLIATLLNVLVGPMAEQERAAERRIEQYEELRAEASRRLLAPLEI
jgi:hypothetical protein